MPAVFFFFISGRVVHEAPEVEETLEDKFSATAEWMSGPAQSLNSTANGHAAKRKRAYTPGKYDACKSSMNKIRYREKE